jgi:hypothetical protein
LHGLLEDFLARLPASGGNSNNDLDEQFDLLKTIAATTNLPFFRAVMLLRFLSLVHPELYSWQRFDPGWGVIVGLDDLVANDASLTKAMHLEFSKRVSMEMADGIKRVDKHNLVGSLAQQGIDILVPANLEHLLCETRKVMASGRRLNRGVPSCNYGEYFIEIAPMLLHAQAAHGCNGTPDYFEPMHQDDAEPAHGGTLDDSEPAHGGTLDDCEPAHGDTLDDSEPAHGDTFDDTEPTHGGALDDSEPAHGVTWQPWDFKFPRNLYHTPHFTNYQQAHARYRQLYQRRYFLRTTTCSHCHDLLPVAQEASDCIRSGRNAVTAARRGLTMEIIEDVNHGSRRIQELALAIVKEARETSNGMARLAEQDPPRTIAPARGESPKLRVSKLCFPYLTQCHVAGQ